MALLHHVGVRSGVERVSPLGYFTDGDRVFVVASFGGSDVNPAWYHNLLANPRTTVEIGSETIPVTAREVTGAERDERFTKIAGSMPMFADYQRKTTRVIPVIELVRDEPVPCSLPRDLPSCVAAISVWSSVRSEALNLLAHADANARRQLLGGALDSLTGSDVGDRLARDITDSARHNRVESRRGGKSRRHTTTTITCWRRQVMIPVPYAGARSPRHGSSQSSIGGCVR